MWEDKCLKLQAVEMTPERMEELEQMGLIIRLRPHHDDLNAGAGETLGQCIYEPKDGYGPHKLITVTVNREGFPGFGTHPDCEEFWLIGDSEMNPMYLLIAKIRKEAFEKKKKEEKLSAADFILFRVKYNDPLVSFFVMNPDVPHGEGIIDRKKGSPSFYVTESRDLPLCVIDMKDYSICIQEESPETLR